MLSVEGNESRMKNWRRFSRGTKMLGLLTEALSLAASGSTRASTLLLAYLACETILSLEREFAEEA